MTGRMRLRVGAGALGLALAVIVGVLVSGVGDGPNLAQCEHEMRAVYVKVLTFGDVRQGERPAACEGATDDQLTKIMGKLIGESLDGTLTSY